MKKDFHQNEIGGAGLKMLLFVVGLFVIGHAAFNYIPTAYSGQSFMQEMQTLVVQLSAIPNGKDPLVEIKTKLRKAGDANGIPADAVIEAKQNNGMLTATVRYNKELDLLPFGLYKYKYQFDHTATPAGFLTK